MRACRGGPAADIAKGRLGTHDMLSGSEHLKRIEPIISAVLVTGAP